MGSLTAPHLSKDEATVYGLKSEERAELVRVCYTFYLANTRFLLSNIHYVPCNLLFAFFILHHLHIYD